jgi:hypothetical protein
VLHGCAKIEELSQSAPPVKAAINDLTKLLLRN